MKNILSGCLLLSLFVFASCGNDAEPKLPAKIVFHFNHLVGNEPVHFDEMLYTNAAGNVYEITEIQWFISDVTLVTENGTKHVLDKGGFAHYVDTGLPGTWTWELPDDIAPGAYSSIAMTFGLKGEKNLPNTFPNPPESNMIWPYHMGGDHGGYHYMKLNGFWMNTAHVRTPYNFHLGVGQEYDEEGHIVAFVQNAFEVTLPASAFTIRAGETRNITLTMHVESWFDTPHTYDHNVFGGMIMNNQEAMHLISENGRDVFSVDLNPTP